MKPQLYPGEVEAVKATLEAGRRYGYGNLIAHLKRQWALALMRDSPRTYEQALEATDVDAYPEGFDIDEMAQ